MVSFIIMTTCKQRPSDPTEESFAQTVFQRKVSLTFSTLSVLESLAPITVKSLVYMLFRPASLVYIKLTVVHVFDKHVNNHKRRLYCGRVGICTSACSPNGHVPEGSLYRSVRSIGMFVIGPITVNLGLAAWNCVVVFDHVVCLSVCLSVPVFLILG